MCPYYRQKMENDKKRSHKMKTHIHDKHMLTARNRSAATAGDCVDVIHLADFLHSKPADSAKALFVKRLYASLPPLVQLCHLLRVINQRYNFEGFVFRWIHQNFRIIQCVVNKSTRCVCSCIPNSECRLFFAMNKPTTSIFETIQ